VYPELEKGHFPFRLLSASYGIASSKTGSIEREDYECCTVELILEGAGFLESNGFSCAPGKGSVYILHKHSDHAYWPEVKDPWKKIFFVIDGELMEYLFQIYRLDKVHYIPDCMHLEKYFMEMLRLRNDVESVHRQAAVIFHSLLEEMHPLVFGGDAIVPEDVRELKKYLDSHIEKKVNLENFCRKHGRSSGHMIRQFKEFFGLSPYDYLMRKRIEAARLMLRHSDLLIKEIAARLQFSDQYYFSNYFKKKTGMSPARYKTHSTS
jgi:AraC-like DNA-binding protein